MLSHHRYMQCKCSKGGQREKKSSCHVMSVHRTYSMFAAAWEIFTNAHEVVIGRWPLTKKREGRLGQGDLSNFLPINSL